MFFHKAYITTFLVFFLTNQFIFPNRQINQHGHKIRVLLEEKNSENVSDFAIRSELGVMIQTLPKTRHPIFIKSQKIQIKVKKSDLFLSLDGKLYKKFKKHKVLIKPVHKHLSLNDKTFKGEIKFEINKKNKTLLIINNLNLEDYIYSVLRYESYSTWPIEMQKIQAIASRSYAIHNMKSRRNKKNKSPFDIKGNNHHQTYNGIHNSKHLKKAVTETKGIIMIYNREPILAMFDACCGGVIPAKMKNTDFKKAPYLARSERCTFCKNYKLYKWKRDLLFSSFINNLKQNPKINKKVNSAGKIHDIKIHERDKAGVVHKIKFVGSRKNVIISGHEFWENQRKIFRSLNFKIKKIRDRIVIHGNGFGHQIGLCQRGARELLKRGWNYKNILKFYYPNTQFAKLKYY